MVTKFTEKVIECKYSDISANYDNICQFVSDHCDYSYINFYEIHYCYISYIWLTIPLFSCLALICFYFLSDTSNKYLSQPLTIISDRLKISQNLAGLTFLAFGNGAPDVISSIVASGDSEDGIDFSMGALMGAGVFVTCFVLSSVVQYSNQVKVNKYKFLRDILIYLLVIGILGLFSLDGKIKLWESILFCSIYFFYVILAFFMDKYWIREASDMDPAIEEKIADSIASDVAIIHYKNKSKSFLSNNDQENFFEENSEKKVLESSEEDKREKDEIFEKFPEEGNYSKKSFTTQYKNKSSFLNQLKNEHFYDNHEGINRGQEQLSSIFNDRQKSLFDKLVKEQYGSLFYRIKKNYFLHTKINWSQKNFAYKVFYSAFEFPVTIMRDFTIPSVSLNKWNKNIFMFQPIFSFSFIVLSTQVYGFFFTNWIYSIFIGIIFLLWIILAYFFTYRNRLPDCEISLCVTAFVMSIFWIWFISEILVDVLKLFGVLLNVPESFLAMTLLAFGNSAPDLSVNIALAKAGYGEMGIAGSIAGPLFNVLIGLGISLIKKNILEGDIKYTIFDFDKRIILFVSFTALTLNLVRLVFHSLILRFKLTISIAYVGYFIYFLFFGAICYFTFISKLL